MISIGTQSPSRILYNSKPIGIVRLGESEIYVDRYGGLPVLMDNAEYAGKNGTMMEVSYYRNIFISGIFDTGDSTKKSYIMSNSFRNAPMFGRWYDDINGSSVDYWRMTNGTVGSRSITSAGRYVTFAIHTEAAPYVWLYDNTNKRFVFKGCKATPNI